MDTAGFAQRLLAARMTRGWTQEHLAEVSGVAKRTIAGLEGQEYRGRWDTVVRLAETLDVSLDWLVWGLGERQRRPAGE